MIATFDARHSSEADESAADDSERSTRSWIAFGSGAAAAAIAGALMLHSNFGARFGAIDDHEPLRWMGSSGHLSASRYFSTLFRDTEIGEWGRARRFRPAYYAVRVGEAVVFGDHPTAWYGMSFALFTVACALFGVAFSRWLVAAAQPLSGRQLHVFSVVGSVIGSLGYASMYAWSGIVTRLGPSELLGLVGVSAAILGFTNLVGEPRRRRWWSLAAAGTWVAVLSKESFLPMAALGAIVAAYRWRCGANGRQELAFAVLCALPASIVTLVLARPVLSGGDVYGRSATGGRYSAALRALDEVPFRGVWLASILVVVAIVTWATTTHTAVERKLVGLFLATTSALVGWSLFDAWFNAGFYLLPRYRAVTDVVVLVLIGGAICLFVSGIRRRVSDPVGVAVIVGVLGVFVGFLYTIDGGIRNAERTASAAEFNRAVTRDFQSGIDDFVDDDSGPVAVVVGQGADYEPAFSVATQVRRRLAVDPDVYLIVAADESSHYPLLDSLREVSVHGAEGWPTTPLTDVDPGVHLRCVFINMSAHDTEHCKADDSVTLVVYGM